MNDLGVMVPCERILARAKEVGADLIGLSGLITPSLDEMAHVAREMDRLGFELPLLIGGATTSRAHTAIKIAPHYKRPVVHVLDASRAVPVTTSLLSEEGRAPFEAELEADYQRLRRAHAGTRHELLTLAQARENRPPLAWAAQDLPLPERLGVQVLDDFSLSTLREYIDWTPFFHTWELKGVYPQILSHDKYGDQAQKLFQEANLLLDQIVRDGSLRARAVYGLFPANSVGDDVEVYADASRQGTLATFHFLRQQTQKKPGEPCRSLADFVAPKSSGLADHLGAFAVTSGHGLKELVQRFRDQHDDYNAIMAEALADRLAEAFAELLHARVRREWGYGRDERFSVHELIAEKYRGIRPAAGYPACPDHSEKGTLWKLCDVEARAGITLTESYAMWPGSSVSGLYFAHPEARYFGVGKLGRDQIVDYAARKGWTVEEVERWLRPNLAYA